MLKAVFSDSTNMSAGKQMKNGFTYYEVDLSTSYSLPAAFYSSLVAFLLVTRYSLLFTRYSLTFTRYCLLVTRYFSTRYLLLFYSCKKESV